MRLFKILSISNYNLILLTSDKRVVGSKPEKKLVASPTKTMRQQPSPLNNSMGSKMNRAHSTPDLAQVFPYLLTITHAL